MDLVVRRGSLSLWFAGMAGRFQDCGLALNLVVGLSLLRLPLLLNCPGLELVYPRRMYAVIF